MNKRGRHSALGAQPAVARNTGSPRSVSFPEAGAPFSQPLPSAIATLLGQAEELASSLFQCAPDRPISGEEIDRLTTFISDTVLQQAAKAAKTPFATAMLNMSAQRFREELGARLAAKLGLRDTPAEGIA